MGKSATRTSTCLLLCLCFCLTFAQTSPTPPYDLISSFEAVAKAAPLWIKYDLNPGIEDSLKQYAAKGDQSNYQVMTQKGSKAAKKKSRSEYLSYVSLNRNDTINIVLLPKAPLNLGYRVVIIRDSCTAFFYAYESEPVSGIFKLNTRDENYVSKILVPPKLCRIVLTNKPTFQTGEIISGYLEFESLPYRIRYDKYYDEAERSYVEGYFNTSDFIINKQE